MAISAESIDFRRENLEDIKTNSYPDLQQYSKLIEIKLRNFKEEKGLDCFIDLFRLSANIPEPLKPDSSEEKVYSKYTDTLLCLMFNFIGIPSEVLAARSDSADVVSVDKQYGLDFVSDAKAFRLSRTAKNQKDFKIAAMDKWKGSRSQAILVCPVYQLPAKSSQIYYQSVQHNVLILTNSHIALLAKYTEKYGRDVSLQLLYRTLEKLKECTQSKSASDYWKVINHSIKHSLDNGVLWNEENLKINDTINAGKEEGSVFYSKEKERIMSLSHVEAIHELLKTSNVISKIQTVQSVSNTEIFDV